jgi:hypothetical protein
MLYFKGQAVTRNATQGKTMSTQIVTRKLTKAQFAKQYCPNGKVEKGTGASSDRFIYRNAKGTLQGEYYHKTGMGFVWHKDHSITQVCGAPSLSVIKGVLKYV